MPTGGDVLLDGLRRAFKYGKCSDCKIVCGPYEFKVHEIVLNSHSPYFEVCLNKETFKEGQTRTIRLEAQSSAPEDGSDVDHSCDDPEMVKRMVSYFYNLSYTCDNNITTDSPNYTYNPRDLITHANMFSLAVKYQVDGLRDFAVKSSRYVVQATWDSNEFLEATTIVLTSTPEEVSELRELVFDTIGDHFNALKDKEAIKELYSSYPLLFYEMFGRQQDWRSNGKRGSPDEYHQCTVCDTHKADYNFVSGLPRNCKDCNSGDPSW